MFLIMDQANKESSAHKFLRKIVTQVRQIRQDFWDANNVETGLRGDTLDALDIFFR